MLFKSKLKLYKRERINLFLKNSYIINKSKFLKKLKSKISYNKKGFFVSTHYSDQIKEKRKIKLIYGISDKVYNNYYYKFKKKNGNIFDNIIKAIECRFDNIIYRSCLSYTRKNAKQMISHNYFKINNQKSNIPSRLLNPGDFISLNYNKNFLLSKINYINLCFNKNIISN